MKLWAIPYLTTSGLRQHWVTARRLLEYEKERLITRKTTLGVYEPIEYEVPVRKESLRCWLNQYCSTFQGTRNE